MTVGGQPRRPRRTARFLIRRIITIEPRISKSDWPGAEPAADRIEVGLSLPSNHGTHSAARDIGAHSELRLMHGSTMGLHVRGSLSNTMKNFVRLVQFAWRYKVRFGLSVACAAMVALLSFTEMGAVYPLLHILFGSQNPQRWISEKIVGLDTDILVAAQPRDRSRACPRGFAERTAAPRRSSTNDTHEVDDEFRQERKASCASTSAASVSPT